MHFTNNMILVLKSTGEQILEGHVATSTVGGQQYRITGGRSPDRAGSTGRVYCVPAASEVKHGKRPMDASFYPTVFGMQFVDQSFPMLKMALSDMCLDQGMPASMVDKQTPLTIDWLMEKWTKAQLCMMEMELREIFVINQEDYETLITGEQGVVSCSQLLKDGLNHLFDKI